MIWNQLSSNITILYGSAIATGTVAADRIAGLPGNKISSGTVDAGECRLRVCQCSDNICQLRLDFDTFVLNQPDTCNFKTVSHYHVLV